MKIRPVVWTSAMGVAALMTPSCAKAPDVPLRQPDAKLEAHCSTLTKRECLSSRECSLILNRLDAASRYRCVAPRSLCEDGIAQDGADIERLCSQRPGCEYEASDCFCHCGPGGTDADLRKPPGPPFCVCYCGGGPAANCIAPRDRADWPL
jgi:hypothetical protein